MGHTTIETNTSAMIFIDAQFYGFMAAQLYGCMSVWLYGEGAHFMAAFGGLLSREGFKSSKQMKYEG